MANKTDTATPAVQEFSLQEQIWKGVFLSDTAAEHIKKISGEQCLHLSVKNSGCTGYAYVLQLIDQPCADDVMFEHNQAKIYVALQAMPILDGTRIDYEQQGLNSTFTYQNPNVKAICGCGESFGV